MRAYLLVLTGCTLFLGQQSFANSAYIDRFHSLWQDLHAPENGYFSAQGIPYHARETLLVEAPDYGHETTSETFSYWLWLEAMHGRLTGNWDSLNSAWLKMEQSVIPTHDDQPTNSFYNASRPATFAGEWEEPNQYPSPLESGVNVGQDPLSDELASTYGTRDIYGTHWLLDVDNWYGYGQRGDGVSKPSYINTFERGPQESVWETVPHPSWEAFKWGGPNGFLDLFVKDNSYARQWRYSNAPDADARSIQAMYWAWRWFQEQGQKDESALPLAKASRLGDYLRYALFDKYFKSIGCEQKYCSPGSGRTSAHYLLSWYYAWGGATDSNAGWAWRIGSSDAHFGYQNPVASWALSTIPAFKPLSPTGADDWGKSLKRQIEFYQWLQSAEGAIAGGATNSWNGRYEAPPTGTSTFYGMAYVANPVYRDPPSNNWFGMQAWSMERMAEYYYLSGDQAASALLDRWVAWAKSQVQLSADGGYAIPSTLNWTGQPQTWTGTPVTNSNLHVTVVDYTADLGVTASLARSFAFYAAAKGKYAGAVDDSVRALAQQLLDRMWTKYRDDQGLSVVEKRDDYQRFFSQVVHVPQGFNGKMASGDAIVPGVTFLGLRSQYQRDPMFATLQKAHAEGVAPQFSYHRFWAQVEVALANAYYALLFTPDLVPVADSGQSNNSSSNNSSGSNSTDVSSGQTGSSGVNGASSGTNPDGTNSDTTVQSRCGCSQASGAGLTTSIMVALGLLVLGVRYHKQRQWRSRV